MGFMDSFKSAKSGPPMPDKKPAMEIAVGVGKPPMSGNEPDGDEGKLSDPEMVAAHSAMTALQSGDAESFGRAMKAFINSCGSGDDDSDSDAAESMPKGMPPGK